MSTANAGADAGNQSAENDDAKPLTRGDMLALLGGFKEEINKSVHTAIGERTKRLTKDFEGRLAAIKTAPVVDEAEGTEGEGGTAAVTTGSTGARTETTRGAAQQQATVDPEVAKLRREVEKVNAKLKESEQKANEADRRRIQTEGHQAIKTGLAGKVVAGAEDAILNMLRGRGAVHFTEDGAVRLKLGGKDEPEDGLEVADGIKALTSLPEFKYFAPPPGSGGNNGVKRTQAQQTTTSTAPRAAPGPQQLAEVSAAFEEKTGKSLADLI